MRMMAMCAFVAAVLVLSGCPDAAQDPGQHGGNLDNFTMLSTPANLLLLQKSYYYYSSFTERPEVMFSFTSPRDFGATSYTVQYSATGEEGTWTVMESGGEPLTTESLDASAYSIDILNDGWLRLAITGGAYDGQFSNEVQVTRCATQAEIEYSIEENLTITGISPPYVGYGLRADFTLTEIDDPSNPDDGNGIVDALTYQWYRVDPNDWEDEELIAGATGLTYVTSAADKGHKMLIKATGVAGKFDGGFCHVLSGYVVGMNIVQ